MHRNLESTTRKILSWIVLVTCLLFAAWYIYSAVWVSALSVAIASRRQFEFTMYALAFMVGGISMFGVIRNFPEIGSLRIGMLVVAVLLALGPKARVFLQVDICLDAGGAWNYVDFKCEK